jgi:hypothetical protein
MREEQEVGQIKFEGITYSKGSFSCLVLARDMYDNILWARGATVPTDGDAKFAAGCLFTLTTDGKPYFNVGTADSCNFDTMTLA